MTSKTDWSGRQWRATRLYLNQELDKYPARDGTICVTGYADQAYGVVVKLLVLSRLPGPRRLKCRLDVTPVSDGGCGGSTASEMPGCSLAGASRRLGIKGVWLGRRDECRSCTGSCTHRRRRICLRSSSVSRAGQLLTRGGVQPRMMLDWHSSDRLLFQGIHLCRGYKC